MNGLLPSQLRSIFHLFQEKDQTRKDIIGNLKPSDVKDDSRFTQTCERIKKEILLVPVTFGEPELGDYSSEERQMPGNYQNPFPHKRQVTTVKVRFPFVGSPELFSHSPNGYSFGGSSTRIYQPDFDNSINIEVEVDKLDKELVLARAKQMMDTTFSLISQIKTQAEDWSKSTVSIVDSALQEKRDELIKFYGK